MEDSNQTQAPAKPDHTSHFSQLLLSRSVGQVTLESGLLFVINLTALTGNLLVSSAIYRNRRLQNSTNVLLLALSATDLFFSSFCLPISLGVLITGRWIYDQSTCWVQCFCIYFAAFSTLKIITLTALNRYVRVVKTRYFNKLFSTKGAIVKVVAIWLGIGFILAVIFACRLARAEFSPAHPACVMFLNRERNHIILSAGTAFFIMVFFSIMPTSVILFCYVRVFQAVKKHFTRIIPSLQAGGNRNLDVNLAELKVTKTLFIVVVGFLLCWSPIMVVEILQGFFIEWWKLPRPVHMLWMYLGALSSALNPFIYGITNASFRKEFRAIICWFKKGTRVTPI